MIGLYDLSNRPASFDFVTWMATVTTMGCDHVRFVYGRWKKKAYTIEQAEERFRSIILPACGLWGIDYSIGEREGEEITHSFQAAFAVHKELGWINKIKKFPVIPKDYVTITLRHSPNRTPERNSNEAEWRKFAKRIGNAIIIRDYDDYPIDLEDRMKLYAGARMNFMTINGPLTLCIHSDAPYLSMRTIGSDTSVSTSPWHMRSIGITEGFQFPWANSNQRLSYLDDTCENIEKEYEALLEQQRKAA